MVSTKQTMIAAALMLQSHASEANRPMNPFPLDDEGTLCQPGGRCVSTEYKPVHVHLMDDPYLGCATYPSACRATCDGRDLQDLRPGRCPIPGEYTDGCIATDEHDPVCGSDGKTYTNSGDAACHQIYEATKGACEEESTTVVVTRPVSGTTEIPIVVTRPVAGSGSASSSSSSTPVGTYVDGCVHILTYDPVCGSNGVTYTNSGEAACYSVSEWESGPCMRGPKHGKAPKRFPYKSHVRGPRHGHKGDPCGKAPEDTVPSVVDFDCDVCPAVYEPLMAIDYTHPRYECQQFDNECEAHCAGIPEADKRFPERVDGRYWVEDGYCPQPGDYVPGCAWLVPLFDHVCGSNGVTYQNAGEAHCNNIFDYTSGFCEDETTHAAAPVPDNM